MAVSGVTHTFVEKSGLKRLTMPDFRHRPFSFVFLLNFSTTWNGTVDKDPAEETSLSWLYSMSCFKKNVPSSLGENEIGVLDSPTQ